MLWNLAIALLLLAFHALNLIILNHNPIHPELISGSLGIACRFSEPVHHFARALAGAYIVVIAITD